MIDFDGPQGERGYRGGPAYFRSKPANLMFTYEPQRRSSAAGAKTIAVAAHPGNAYTNFGRELTWWLMRSQEMGALGTLRAAVDSGVRGGEYYGSSQWSHDVAAQQRLWRESERSSGVEYPI